ncbi:hypothetical protein SNE40_003911 [Patella caerulea]|uniref:Sigma intracellular receptor 2 n=1 Tax=Patella caerulea TaxID=87958 RepID=A0AAN8KHP9_PATCE
MARILDIVFFLYFVSHIPFTFFLNSQGIIPKRFFPKICVALKEWYTHAARDPLMGDPKPWFISFCFCEITIQLVCFFMGVYVFYKGVEKCRWSRIPLMLYGSHTATTVFSIGFEIMFGDFRDYNHPAPRNMNERLFLLAIYSPYLIIPLLLVFDTVFSPIYRETKITTNGKTKVK